ncbi:MAG: excinuclease ABC subunit UvrC [Saprospiraceae bacterium]|jgi:excinuclease ABC subunit C|nr:excinuclease ABC subunit UvrC [Candidatus Parvibacillus calidus]MBX2937447.1 excinuclease ABC subunit UvrC [Saprospiraceae bacterium]MBX7178925.1 excinuclease ABC subunit UvrC [Saprospiraceae bacterium]MCB0589833.1 excinuclease ABC subunit UvrC [Saprospiraceae bacterium]MCO5284281.1 excinuclease ABC subunit UvrC [Saprospiraceae bacterium]
MKKEAFREISPSIPREPGVYRFMDKDDNIIYVGKAKNLKNRLTSYFNSTNKAGKTRIMVDHADHLEYTVVETEHDALLLEATFIKKFQPRYNVMLKDGKSYAYICIRKEPFPRVFFTRKVIKDGSTYFGPFTSKFRVQQILDLIKNLFPLRTCNLNLTPENIRKGKFKVCLEYHLKNCMGPCEGLESEEAYNAKIDQIKNIMRGNFAPVKAYLREQMDAFAENLEFERAAEMKNKLSLFEDYQAKSMVVSTTIRDVDVFAYHAEENEFYINYIKVVNGMMINTFLQEGIRNLDDDAFNFSYGIRQLRERFNSIAPEVLVNMEGVILDEKELKVQIPSIGDKRKLMEMAEKNIHFYLLQKRKESINAPRVTPTQRIMETLQKDLNMDRLPNHIECFDNSNIQGTNPVSSCVVFKNAKPAKSEYRKFNVKTVDGPNDFATMEEVVTRRYTRLLEEGQPLPDLIIIDGGKGQLGVAAEVLTKLGILGKVTLIGIAKRLEEIYFPGDSLPLYINKKSESLKLIQHLRNEAHRFAITFHRKKRSMNFTVSELTQIDGIGKATAEKLLQHFKSVKRIAAASPEELAGVTGKRAANIVFKYYNRAEEEGEEEVPEVG